MARFSLTICGLSLLLGLTALGQQSTTPQVSTGVGSRPAQYRPPANIPIVRFPRPAAGAARQPATQKPAAGARVNPQPGVVAPKKDPATSGAPAASAATEPMGPPYPVPEVPKPSRPADMPPSPPQVSFHDGMLTVHALNSTMSSVLQAIRSKTGIEFEGAGNSAERVAVNMGPAPEGDVLASIFSGSSFDYVVLGRPDSPGIVQRVILTPRAKGGAAVAGGPPQPFQRQPQVQAQQQAEEDANEEATPADDDPQDSANQPPPVQEPPAAQNEPQQQQQNEAQQNENQQNAPKTPEQLLQELKQMQLQQQQQQGQPPPDTNSVPRKVPPR